MRRVNKYIQFLLMAGLLCMSGESVYATTENVEQNEVTDEAGQYGLSGAAELCEVDFIQKESWTEETIEQDPEENCAVSGEDAMEDSTDDNTEEPGTMLCVNTLGGRAFGYPGDTVMEISLSEDVTGRNGIKGSDVIAYAFQYVGNAYVWGGESLTDGCDCSGYIMQVMEHFGIYFPHDSYSAADYGIAVTKENVKLGDVLIYNDGGHVALYMGEGKILEAEGAEWGIVAGDRQAFCYLDGSEKECLIRRYI